MNGPLLAKFASNGPFIARGQTVTGTFSSVATGAVFLSRITRKATTAAASTPTALTRNVVDIAEVNDSRAAVIRPPSPVAKASPIESRACAGADSGICEVNRVETTLP